MRQVSLIVLFAATTAVGYHTHCLIERCDDRAALSAASHPTAAGDVGCRGEVSCVAWEGGGPVSAVSAVPPVASSVVAAPRERPARLDLARAPAPRPASTSLQPLLQTFLN